MAMDVDIVGGVTGNKAEVDTNGNLKVVQPQSIAQGGYVGLMGIIDEGTVIAGGRRRAVSVTEGNSLVITHKNLLWDDTFNATAQNTAKYRAPVTTQTVTFGAGFVTLNGGSITTINTNSAYQTYKSFPLFANSELRTTISMLHTVAPQTSAVTEIGLFSATLPGAAAPTDGVFFRYNAAAELRGVISYNGTETQTVAITPPAVNITHDYQIVTNTNTVLFFIDQVLVGRIFLITDAPGLGQPFLSASQPITARHYIAGTSPALAAQFRITDIYINMLGSDIGRNWATIKSGFGHMGYQGQNGNTMGSTALYVNNANPTAAVPTNTSAALGSGLGGNFFSTAAIAVTTDGIVSSFQVPTGTANATGRNLIVTGVTIDSIVQTTLTGGPFILQWGLAFGHTAVSLATGESATSKAPRRLALGFQSLAVTAPAGAQAGRIQLSLLNPITVAPGEFIQTFYKNIGTVGTAGVIAHTVTFDCYFE